MRQMGTYNLARRFAVSIGGRMLHLHTVSVPGMSTASGIGRCWKLTGAPASALQADCGSAQYPHYSMYCTIHSVTYVAGRPPACGYGSDHGARSGASLGVNRGG